MNKKIKILHIISDKNFGGAGRLLLNLSQCINKEAFECFFAVPKNSRLISKLDKEGTVFFYNGKGDKSVEISAIPSLCRIIRNTTPDIVHSHSSFSGKIAVKICKNKIKSVYTKHCVFKLPKTNKSKLYRKIYRFIDNIFADKIIAVAEAAKTELVSKGIDPQKISVIINGSFKLKEYDDLQIAKLKQQLGISENDFVVGIVARLEEYKGHKTLLNAAAKSKIEGNNIKFLIIGDGSMREELEHYSEKLHITDRVIFTGFIDNIDLYMNILDLNINCSTGTETSCLAISEGASIGVPAVVSDFGGNPNMIINGKTGYIFPQNNANELYKIINNLKESPLILNKMRTNIKNDYYKRFAAEKMAIEYEKFYLKLK